MTGRDDYPGGDEDRSIRRTILIVDDDITIRTSILDLLSISGYQVYSASDGLEALGVLERHVPDLIISDITMPTMDGYAFFEAVRDNTSWTLIPFIFLTALGQAQDIRHGIRLGVDQYLVKPFEPEDLLIAVEARLKRIHQIEEATHSDVEMMKRRLMTAISHELRTPLTYIYGYVNLLQEEDAELSTGERQGMISAIQRGAERLTRLVEDLLFAARLESGEIASEVRSGRKPTQLDTLLTEMVNGKASAGKEYDTAIETTIPPGMTLSCEPAYLRNALARLVDNAIKFTRSPGGHVWITAAQDGEMIRISVQDDGMGVSVDKQKLLFQPLQQIDREQHEQQGIGIGLTIARGIVEAHGGFIEVSSEGMPGQGSTFTIVLPA